MAFITHGDKTPHNIFTKQLRINNLLGNKHIPHIYKTATRHDRLELLAGLMDTDGSLANGGYDFISRDKQLSLDVVFLARSLGLAAYFNVSMKKAQSMQEAREHYRVSISGDCSIIPCRVARKRASVRKQAKDVLRTGIKLEPLGIGEYFGFEISGSDRLFLLGDFTVTHNTLMLSEVARRHGGKTLVLQHRDELVSQNIKTWNTVNPRAAISLFTAGQKSWRGNATFAMAPTLSRADNLKTIPKLDLFIIDEAHHAVADSYMRIVEAVKEKNPDCHIAGFTATPNRGDGKGLRPVFNNCAGQITLEELVTLGFLVKPRAFVCKLAGVPEQLDKVGLKGGEYDMASVEAIMNSTINNQTIVQQWREQAGGRRTIVFCSTVSHARDIAKAFVDAGIKAATVEGDMPAAERAANLQALENGNLQVLCNVAVLTEGFDCPPVSCVVLLRPCSHKSTMLQMIGRGLRILDASKYPGQVKTDCLILDFGTSLLNHGSLNTVVDLDDRTKTCATCGSLIPMPCKQCPICGADCIAIGPGGGAAEGIGGDGEAGQVSLTEIDIINMSPFKWMDIFDTGKVWMACGFNACVCVATSNRNNWTAIGKLKGQPARALQVGEKIPAFASADDFMRNYENDDAAKKSKTWLNHPASWKQMEHLNRLGYPTATDFNWTKYKAVCALNFGWNQTAIERLLFSND